MSRNRTRTYWEDFETGRRGFTEGELPDGPLVEAISAFEFYDREGVCVCGKRENDGVRCLYGASHQTLHSLDDEALS